MFDVSSEIFAVPSNDTPAIVLAVSKAVAVAALPVVEPELPLTFPVTLPVTFPVIFPVTLPVIVPDAVIVPTQILGVPVKFDASDAVPVTLPVNGPLKALAVIVPVAVKSPPVFILNPLLFPSPSVIDCKDEANVPLSPTFINDVYVLLIELPVRLAIVQFFFKIFFQFYNIYFFYFISFHKTHPLNKLSLSG